MAKKSKPHDHEEHMDETWLIPYADLLTLLLALFIVLFASSSVDTKKFEQMMVSFNSVLSGGDGIFETSTVVPIDSNPGGKGKDSEKDEGNPSADDMPQMSKGLQEKIRQETAELENLKQKIDKYIKDNGLNSQLTTELNNFQLVLRISDNALFPSGSASVKPEARKLAVAISGLLVVYPQYEVGVSGHTDDQPIKTSQFSDNWDLSTARSLNFMKILIDNKKLDPGRFSSTGYGEHHPIDTNDTEAGRSANRRVEVSIIRNIVEATPETVKVK